MNMRKTGVSAALLALFLPGVLSADGYRNPPEGARAIGSIGGRRAFADDATATVHNPANLPDLERPMIQVNTALGYGRTRFENNAASERTRDPFFGMPGFSIAAPFSDGKFAAGLAAYVPYGRSVEWDDNSFFANNNYPSAGKMTVADLTPNAAVRLTDTLTVAAGLDLYYGEVEQTTFYNPFAPPYPLLPPGTRSTLTADGTAVGWNTAATWKFTERQRLAATLRSPFDIDYEGENKLSLGMESDVDATIRYPTIAGLAYGIEITDTLRAEVNGEWLEFSRYDDLVINDSLFGRQTLPQQLNDTWTAGCGLSWNFKPQWTLRTGYLYLKNPTPERTYGTLGPDEDQGVASLGLGYETGNHAIDIGYAYGLFDGRNISGSYASPDGRYDYTVHLLALSYGYKF